MIAVSQTAPDTASAAPLTETAADLAGEPRRMRLDPLVVQWYAPLAAGLVPVLLLGFAWSALADRLAFVVWALAAAAGWAILLRHGIEAGWARGRRLASLALWLALGLAGFAALESAHHEILDLGFRAVLPGLYHPGLTRPRTALVLAAVLALAAGAAAGSGLVDRRRPEARA
jgi:hypothetical protein